MKIDDDDWLKANKLSLNVNTTKAMVFHMSQKWIQLHLLKIAGADIELVDNFNFLGIIIGKQCDHVFSSSKYR